MSGNGGFRALAEAQRLLPSTQLAELPGGRVEYLTAGEGRPAVVLLGGVGISHGGWALVVRELASVSTVFAHNRPGVGGSVTPQRPQTGTAVVDLLRVTLDAAGLEPPYVVVGHALGGLYAQLYGRLFPDELAGLVLLEATHPDDDVLERHFRFLPRSVTRAMMAAAVTRSRRNAELRFVGQTAREIEQAGPFPDVPLAVVSGAKTPSRLAMSRARVENHEARQRELVSLSAHGRQITAARSGHFPQITDPELVVEVVREVVPGGGGG